MQEAVRGPCGLDCGSPLTKPQKYDVFQNIFMLFMRMRVSDHPVVDLIIFLLVGPTEYPCSLSQG